MLMDQGLGFSFGTVAGAVGRHSRRCSGIHSAVYFPLSP